MVHLLKRLERVAAGCLRVWLLVGILLRVTRWRDAWHPVSPIFYSTPWPVIASGLALLGLHARRVGYGHAFRRYVILTAAALFIWLALSWYSNPPPAPLVEPIRVVAWNVGRPHALRLGMISRWLHTRNPDLIAVAEAQPLHENDVDAWRAAFPGYEVQPFIGEMMCLVRGDIRVLQQGELAFNSQCAEYEVTIRGQKFVVLQADLYAIPRYPRLPALHRLAELARPHAGEKMLVVGDFNTPRESAGFDELRPFLDHAFEKAGSGLAETWPMVAPALSVDHLWATPATGLRSCWIGWSLLSDHRPVVAEFAP